jgi:hypothetical protein
MYKTERLELRLTRREVELLDQIRGSTSRSQWLRSQIIHAAHTHQNVHPQPLPGPNTHSIEVDDF